MAEAVVDRDVPQDLSADPVGVAEATEAELVEAELQPRRRRRRARKNRFNAEVGDGEAEVAPFTMEDVSAFLLERQAVWYKKEVLHEEKPWTDDSVLREWRICNIYRELDAGTRFVIKNIVDAHVSDADRLLNVLIYRLLNRADSWERNVGLLATPYRDSVERAFNRLQEASQNGEKVGTNTWRASALAELYHSALLIVDGFEELLAIARAATSLQTFHSVLSRGYDIGDFTAYQMALDAQYVFPNLDNSDWVYVGGTGARKGGHGGSMWTLRRLAAEGEQPIDTCRRLRDTQDEWLPDGWLEVAWEHRPRLSLADVDNLMCEFRKYWLKKHGQGALRRYGPEPAVRRSRSSGGRRRSEGRGSRRSEAVNWQTPPQLFQQLHEEFSFTVDAAASDDSHLLDHYLTEEADALAELWNGQTVYAFPPFNEMREWTEKAASEAERGVTTVMLCPAYSETRWWHENVVEAAYEIRMIRGMVQFFESGEPRKTVFQAPIAIVVFKPHVREPNQINPRTIWGYTYPDRPVVEKSGWTGNL